jgi:ComF family protein
MGLISIDTQVWKQGKQQFLNVFLSGSCVLCHRPSSDSLCSSCQRQVEQTQLFHSLYQGQAGLPVISWGSYEGTLKQAIACLKYEHRRDVAQYLGTELARTWISTTSSSSFGQRKRPAVIVPIPLHASRLQQRGFNQAEILAQWFCRFTHLPLQARLLKRTQATEAQHSLNRKARFHNLAQAFEVAQPYKKQLKHVAVWLLDDIFTTGATTVAAAQVLRRHGISVAGVCTVARTLSATEIHSCKT